MSYIVFARKYRPRVFDEVAGQSHITTTLKNAIAQNRVAHAYIFAGPRGVGKTTTARILAKALNCEKGPTIDPCNKCSSCVEIIQGASLDVLEIDGASNRGIDEIRNLRENVKFAPSRGRFKVYIIDEVHMLTSEAFNALLKTLEEPPPHVKFIFATTQAHKVPPTILSRCQRFDFRRLAVKDIVDNLKAIVKKEDLTCDDEVLVLIAKYADGSMRDAQVVFDQIVSFTDGKISPDNASRILGAISDDVLFVLADSIKKRDPVMALKTIDEMADEGKDIVQVILCLIEHFRNLSVIKVADNPSSLIDASSEKINRYAEQAAQFTVEEILYIIYTFSGALDFARKSDMARVFFETAMVKLTRSISIMPPEEIIRRLDKLKEILEKKPERNTEEKPVEEAPKAQNVKSAKSATLSEIVSLWPAILNQIKERKISIAMYLKEGYPALFEADTLSIEFPRQSKFHKEMLDTPDCKTLILKAIKEASGLDVKVKFTISERLTAPEDNASKDAMGKSMDSGSIKDDEEPLINEALEIFNGEIEKSRGRQR